MEDILGRTVENLPKIAIWTGLWTAAYFLFTRFEFLLLVSLRLYFFQKSLYKHTIHPNNVIVMEKDSALTLGNLLQSFQMDLESVLFFHFLNLVVYRLSRISSTYETLPKTKKADWNIRLVSQLHAILICALSFPLLFDEHLLSDKVFSYSSYSSNVYCIATGSLSLLSLLSLSFSLISLFPSSFLLLIS